jgi:hypothetical protein
MNLDNTDLFRTTFSSRTNSYFLELCYQSSERLFSRLIHAKESYEFLSYFITKIR